MRFLALGSMTALVLLTGFACSDTSDDPAPSSPTDSDGATNLSTTDGSTTQPVDAAGVSADGSTNSSTDGSTDGAADASPPTPQVLPAQGIGASELGVIVNSDDPQSVDVGAYYVQKRGIPAANVITLSLGASFATNLTRKVSSATFAGWKSQLDANTPANVQAYAVTFIYPSVVDCMSLTSAIAFGFDAKYCSTPCNTTAASPWYGSTSSVPFTKHAMRPAMVIASKTAVGAKTLVDRGVSSDLTFPLARGYLIKTSDNNRNVRYPDFISANTAWNKPQSLAFTYIDNANSISNKTDVLFYFTGLSTVPDIATNQYVPGGVADHLTSYGGQIPDSGQMSILRWIEAGATGSYGTVVEPCNYPTKFPAVSMFLKHYFAGEPLIEAYWKSVNMPGEGLFIGEPLARPYGTTSSMNGTTLVLKTTALEPAVKYRVETSSTAQGPWTTVKSNVETPHRAVVSIEIPSADGAFYRVVTP